MENKETLSKIIFLIRELEFTKERIKSAGPHALDIELALLNQQVLNLFAQIQQYNRISVGKTNLTIPKADSFKIPVEVSQPFSQDLNSTPIAAESKKENPPITLEKPQSEAEEIHIRGLDERPKEEKKLEVQPMVKTEYEREDIRLPETKIEVKQEEVKIPEPIIERPAKVEKIKEETEVTTPVELPKEQSQKAEIITPQPESPIQSSPQEQFQPLSQSQIDSAPKEQPRPSHVESAPQEQIQRPTQSPIDSKPKEEPQTQQSKPIEEKPKNDIASVYARARERVLQLNHHKSNTEDNPASPSTIANRNVQDSGSQGITDKIKQTPISDLRTALSINQRITFTNKLFHGDDKEFKRVVATLNNFSNFAEAKMFLLTDIAKKQNWDMELPVVEEFMELTHRKFL